MPLLSGKCWLSHWSASACGTQDPWLLLAKALPLLPVSQPASYWATPCFYELRPTLSLSAFTLGCYLSTKFPCKLSRPGSPTQLLYAGRWRQTFPLSDCLHRVFASDAHCPAQGSNGACTGCPGPQQFLSDSTNSTFCRRSFSPCPA